MNEENKNNHLKIGELPDLRVLHVDSLMFHEDPDEGRLLNLVNRLGAEGILKNPPIVAVADHGRRFIILDGANRVTALKKLKYENIPVQVVHPDDPGLEIRCWHHAVEKLGPDYFLHHISGMTEIRLQKTEPAQAARNSDDSECNPEHARDGYLCQFLFENGETYAAYNGGDLLDQLSHLKKLTDLYLDTGNSDRVSYANFEHLKINYPEFRTLITFRRFCIDEVEKIVLAGRKLPAGITRVLLPKRALGLNIRLEFLKSDLTLDEKNRWLTEMIHKMVLAKAIRFYQEPTFRFDE
ncbi:conserved hypothetical protein [Candidatus Zixiibacteriota bacterium]|nr:conserved hypothetical protein [candidate division Zixibacteria bacterium]